LQPTSPIASLPFGVALRVQMSELFRGKFPPVLRKAEKRQKKVAPAEKGATYNTITVLKVKYLRYQSDNAMFF